MLLSASNKYNKSSKCKFEGELYGSMIVFAATITKHLKQASMLNLQIMVQNQCLLHQAITPIFMMDIFVSPNTTTQIVTLTCSFNKNTNSFSNVNGMNSLNNMANNMGVNNAGRLTNGYFCPNGNNVNANLNSTNANGNNNGRNAMCGRRHFDNSSSHVPETTRI